MKWYKNEVASFDVDAQKGFSELCPNELPVPKALEIVEPLNKQAKFAKLRVGSKDAHNSNAVWIADSKNPQFSKVGLPNSDIRWNSHCIMGEKGAELLPKLPKVTDYDFFVWKGIESDMHPYGAIYHDLNDKMSTGVAEYLKLNGIKVVIVGGLATDYCVKNTVLQLLRFGFSVILNLEASRGITEDGCNSAINEMKNGGAYIINETFELGNFII